MSKNTGTWGQVNVYCSNFNTSPLNDWIVTSSRMPSKSDWGKIPYETGLTTRGIASQQFWLSDGSGGGEGRYYVDYDGLVQYCNAPGSNTHGARPLITLVKL